MKFVSSELLVVVVIALCGCRQEAPPVDEQQREAIFKAGEQSERVLKVLVEGVEKNNREAIERLNAIRSDLSRVRDDESAKQALLGYYRGVKREKSLEQIAPLDKRIQDRASNANDLSEAKKALSAEFKAVAEKYPKTFIAVTREWERERR